MNAQLKPLESKEVLNDDLRRSFANSKKIYVQGSRPDIQVPMREISLSETPKMFGAESNGSLTVYDTAGPYTDPHIEIDLAKGLPPLRAPWINERADFSILSGPSSQFGQKRAHDSKTAHIRFPQPQPNSQHSKWQQPFQFLT